MERNQNNPFQMIADYEGDIESLFDVHVDTDIPILATRNMVLFPGVISPILVGRRSSVNLVRKVHDKESAIIGVFCQKDPNVESPTYNDLYDYGVYARVIRVLCVF